MCHELDYDLFARIDKIFLGLEEKFDDEAVLMQYASAAIESLCPPVGRALWNHCVRMSNAKLGRDEHGRLKEPVDGQVFWGPSFE